MQAFGRPTDTKSIAPSAGLHWQDAGISNSQEQLTDNPDPLAVDGTSPRPSLGSRAGSLAVEDWISPFTLPPLPSPTHRRNRSDLAKPAPKHRKSSSSAYYAAVWGSPITPESHRRQSAVPQPSIDSNLGNNFNQRKSEKGNWLSDSEGSARHSPHDSCSGDSGERWHVLTSAEEGAESISTPTRNASSGVQDTWTASSTQPHHRLHDSTATVRQSDIWTTLTNGESIQALPRREMEETQAAQSANAQHNGMMSATLKDKPLPSPPSQLDGPTDLPNFPSRPQLRPSSSSFQSFQRPKRRVVWKGKSCIIALPLEDDRGTGDKQLLTPEDASIRIRQWEEQGLDTHGFTLGSSIDGLASLSTAGQSRAVHPDPADMFVESKMRGYRVHIPDRAAWEAWMEQVKEEKLRALGVTTSDSEPPTSTISPFSGSISRTASSQYPSMPMSPPYPPSGLSNHTSQSGGLLSPQMHPSMNHYNATALRPNAAAWMVSPGSFTGPQSISPMSGQRSPPHYFAQRQSSVSPVALGSMQSLGEALSPVSPFPMESQGQAPPSSYLLDRMRRQQEELQGQLRDQRELRPPTTQSRTNGGLAVSSIHALEGADGFELRHPTPRSHHRNFSVALQKDVDEAESMLEQSDNAQHFQQEVENSKVEKADADSTPKFDTRARLPSANTPEVAKVTDPLDDSEIQTNPSLPTSPKPVVEVNSQSEKMGTPSVRPEEPKTNGASRPGLAVNPSVSKLNVKAPEFKFDPKAAFSSTNFYFGQDSFYPASKAPQLNAAAPPFKPSTSVSDRPSASQFNFSSATFNIEASEFKPLGLMAQNASLPTPAVSAGQLSSLGKIFGNVNVEPLSKATRRSNKAVPILSTELSRIEKDADERNKVEDDEFGRPAPSLARSKRARRGGSDGDRDAVYATRPSENAELQPLEPADSAPDAPLKSTESQEAEAMKLDIQATTAPTQVAVVPKTEAGEISPDKWEPYAFRDDKDASVFNDARLGIPFKTPDNVGQSVLPSATLHQSKPSLSALAKPFEPTFVTRLSSVPDSNDDLPKPRKAAGLEASRFAKSPSPPRSPMSGSPLEVVSQSEGDVARADRGFVSPPVPEIAASSPVAQPQSSISSISQPEGSINHADQEATLQPQVSEQLGTSVLSYEEIDAVMRQFENDPDLGIERLASPHVQSTPLSIPQFEARANIRSDAPSPSPRKQVLDHVVKESPEPPFVNRLRQDRDGSASDWNDTMSLADDEKFRNQAPFFDAHVETLVGGILDNRIGPLETTLKSIQESVSLIATRPSSRRKRQSFTSETKESDADDEDDFDDLAAVAPYRSRSPDKRKNRNRVPDGIKIAVMEALAAHKIETMPSPQRDPDALGRTLEEITRLTERLAPETRQAELKSVVEDVIGTHPRLRGHRVQHSHDGTSSEEKSRLQISGLESMLKMANERADEEVSCRRKVEDELAITIRELRLVQEEAAQHREASEEAEKSLQAYRKEQEVADNLEEAVEELNLKNAALETTLEDYRLSSDQWRDDIRDEREKNKELQQSLRTLRRQVDESAETKNVLRDKVARLHHDISGVFKDVAADQAVWRKQEHELVARHELLQRSHEHEIRRRDKAELELIDLNREHKLNLQFRDRCAYLQDEISRLHTENATMRSEIKDSHDTTFRLERELQHATASSGVQIDKATAALETQLKQAISHSQITQRDLEAQTVRLKSSLENADSDALGTKRRHDLVMEETVEAHTRALQKAAEEKENALQDQHDGHGKKLNDLRERHTRALHNSSDDRHRLEHHLNEKLSLSDEKVQHLESKVTDLEERLEITRSAARAAVEAATSKGINPPTPAPSVVASPPHPVTASVPLIKGSDIPEKISPQALRESIMVLQDQLQHREQTIEKLEAELAEVDKEAPAKVKDRETEIGWLRELLGVRIDDLEDIIKTLSQPDYDRDSVRDAAIRLRANLQMEQQEKERAASGNYVFPSIASLSNLTQSPRALPMAAAAAWGNWRKARDSSFGALSDLANLGSQTPSKSTVGGSPQSFLQGLMTPPSTMQREPTPTPGTARAPPAMKALGATGRKASGEARPLRAYNSQARTLSARQVEKQPTSASRPLRQHSHPEPPSTPPPMRKSSYDVDADVQSLGGDVDQDASLISDKENSSDQPFGEIESVSTPTEA